MDEIARGSSIIKVEPYWNVNVEHKRNDFKIPIIKVEPYWNVNL